MQLYNAARCLCQALFFPQACVLCRRWVVNRDFSPLCSVCADSLEAHTPPVCYYCGMSLPGTLTELHAVCSNCRDQAHLFDCARSTGPYQGRLRDLIRKFKFDGFQRLVYPLAWRLEKTYRENEARFEADCLVPVPLHRARRRERGFDQTLLLARILSARLKVPVFGGLRRVRQTAPQFGLDIEERRRNLSGAFELREPERLAGRRVLLLDDVLTTGATVDEICGLVRSLVRAREIMVLTVARVPLLRASF